MWLYSCQCGVGPDVLAAFHIGGPNTALFGFGQIVFSTLVNGNSQNERPYNNSEGDIVMVDKLSGHVERLLGEMVIGRKASEALSTANADFPPRKFSHAENSINLMDVLPMARSGDADTTLHKIYRSAGESDQLVQQFGEWGLVIKEIVAMPIAP